MRVLLAAGMLLLAAACSSPSGGSPSSAAPTGAAPAASTGSMADPTEVVVKDFTIEPADVTASAGRVDLAVTNEGPTVHNLTIRTDAGDVLAATPDLRPAASDVLSAEIAPGAYVMFCSLPGHESLGMKGTLEVAP